MSNRISFVFAAVGAVALATAPALAKSHHHKGNPSPQASSVQDPTRYLMDHDIPVRDKTSPDVTSTTTTTAAVAHKPARHGAAAAYASAPRSSAAQDPTMYLVNHDIPVKDKSSPGN